MADSHQTHSGAPPPPAVARDRRKAAILIASGVALAILLLVVAISLDRQAPRPDHSDRAGRSVVDIVPPDPLDPDERTASSGATGENIRPGDIGEIERGWIQVEANGRLAQQYHFQRLDPNPEGRGPGWFHMTQPRLEVYLSGDRALLLTGASALTYAPDRAIESGTITGDVVIRMFEDVDPQRDEWRDRDPSLEIQTTEAVLDNVLGEVRCADAIYLQTSSGEFLGRTLSFSYNDQQNIINHLAVESVDHVRFAMKSSVEPEPISRDEVNADARSNDSSDNRATALPVEKVAQVAPPTTPSAKTDAKPSEPVPARSTAATGATDAQFYRLTLHDEVRIRQGAEGAERTATGNELNLIFTMDSEGFGEVLALNGSIPDHAPELIATSTGESAPLHLSRWIASTMIAFVDPDSSRTIAPNPTDDDVWITCRGRLTVTPITNPDERLASAKDARLELRGTPVRMNDEIENARAVCDHLQYNTLEGRLELVGSEAHRLTMESPELDATADSFWIVRPQQIGGFNGAGAMTMRDMPEVDSPAPSADPGSVSPRMSVSWARRVDLAFDDATGDGMLGGIRSATFHDDVHATGREMAIAGTNDESPRDLSIASAAGNHRGELKCGLLAVNFQRDAGGASYIHQIFAEREVMLTDAEQTLWAERIDAELRSPDELGAQDESDTRIRSFSAQDQVQLRLAGGERAFGDHLTFDGAQRTAILSGDDVRLVDGASLIDQMQHITINDRMRTYHADGRGRLRRFSNPIIENNHSTRLEMASLERAANSLEEMRITWRDGVTVMPVQPAQPVHEPDELDQLPNIARFRGDVQVSTPELRLEHADEMLVHLPPRSSGDSRAGINAIDATGGVIAQSVGEPGEIRCEVLHVDLAQNERGEMIPVRMIADERITLRDPQQQMWTEHLLVTFMPVQSEGEEASLSEVNDGRGFRSARVQVDRVTADRGVHMILADGEHIFADRLEAEAVREIANLYGSRVQVISYDFILDHCQRLSLDRSAGTYRVIGPGEFHAFANRIALPDGGFVAPLDPTAETTIDATWTTGARFVEETGGRGILRLEGDVDASSRPTPLERSTAKGQVLELTFVESIPMNGDEPVRELVSLLAEGSAQLENHTWRTPDHSDTSRVFFVTGEHIEYDCLTLESLVRGEGELLLRDEWVDADAANDSAARGFASKGTTLFRWADSLKMTRQIDDRYLITMIGDIRYLHRGLDERTATMTGEWLDATVRRTGVQSDMQQNPGEMSPGGGVIDLGGAMEPLRLEGTGAIFVRTPERDVWCDAFDYNTLTGIAEISARPGKTVTVLNAGSDRPLRAERALWNMDPAVGTITVVRGSAAGAP